MNGPLMGIPSPPCPHVQPHSHTLHSRAHRFSCKWRWRGRTFSHAHPPVFTETHAIIWSLLNCQGYSVYCKEQSGAFCLMSFLSVLCKPCPQAFSKIIQLQQRLKMCSLWNPLSIMILFQILFLSYTDFIQISRLIPKIVMLQLGRTWFQVLT